MLQKGYFINSYFSIKYLNKIIKYQYQQKVLIISGADTDRYPKKMSDITNTDAIPILSVHL